MFFQPGYNILQLHFIRGQTLQESYLFFVGGVNGITELGQNGLGDYESGPLVTIYEGVPCYDLIKQETGEFFNPQAMAPYSFYNYPVGFVLDVLEGPGSRIPGSPPSFSMVAS